MQYIIFKEDTDQLIAKIDTNSPDIILAEGYDISIVGTQKKPESET